MKAFLKYLEQFYYVDFENWQDEYMVLPDNTLLRVKWEQGLCAPIFHPEEATDIRKGETPEETAKLYNAVVLEPTNSRGRIAPYIE